MVEPKKIEKVFAEGLAHNGFSFFDIFSNCHINLGRKNKMGEAINTLNWIESLTVPKSRYDTLSAEEQAGKFPTGVLHHDTDRIEYCKAYESVRLKAQGARK
ncbi:hypothetical protein AGMMS49521_0860 [Campylobacterota bacterium]|nr:hypothetical protein AGMMS49521_0860 [Campylobacterota bacterium]